MKETHSQLPLIVDLDGSLIKTELPWESFLSVLVKHPVELMKIIWRKAGTRIKEEGYFKIELEKWANLSLEKMPFSSQFLNYLKEERALGRQLILCTGSTQSYAEQIQKITGNLFDTVWGSTLGKNLAGRKKAMFLVGKYGEKGFDYAGNSIVDFNVAKYARHFILVNPSFISAFFSRKTNIHRQFMDKKLDPSLFAGTLGFPLWFLNCVMLILPVFLSSAISNLFFIFVFSVVHFNFSSSAFHIFFKMTRADYDRTNISGKSDNLFSTGDLDLSVGFLLSGVFLFLTLVSLVFLTVYAPFSIISSLFYAFCIYLLVYGKIVNTPVPVAVRYLLIISVVLLQGLFLLRA